MIDAMTLAEAGEIFDYWSGNPPPHLMLQTIAATLGWTPRSPAASEPEDGGIASMPLPGIAVSSRAEGLPMPAPVLDVREMRARNAARAAEIATRSAGGRTVR